MNAVIHVDESNRWLLALTSVKNILSYSNSNNVDFRIEIVANGVAVLELSEKTSRNKELRSVMQDLADNQVDIVACRNAIQNHEIDENDLYPFIRVVPAGIVEIIAKQSEGFAYVKP